MKKVILGKLIPLAEAKTFTAVFYQVSPRLNQGAVFSGLVNALCTLKMKTNFFVLYISGIQG